VSPNSVILRMSRIEYLSSIDEDIFFEWLGKIGCVSDYRGVGDQLLVTVAMQKLDDKSLRELIALFYRYRADMKQLAIFRDDDNRQWFSDPEKYWHKSIFG